MPQEQNPAVLSREDYEVIEAAVMETSRGRWFLAEFARRNRHADTTILLDAISRLEKRVAPSAHGDGDLHLRRELTDMAEAISQTKIDLAHSIVEGTGLAEPPKPERAFEDMVQASEKADTVVLNAAEHVQEIAWALREGADDGRAIEDLDRQALEIYRASNQHALTTTRVRSIVGVLRDMERRLDAMVGSWRGELAFVGQSSSDAAGPRRSRLDPETVLDTAPSRIRDDIVFVEAPRFEDRRKPMEPSPIRLGEAPGSRSDEAERPQAPAPSLVPVEHSDDNPFAEIDALPDRRRLVLFV